MTKARDTANLTGSGVGLSLLDIDAGTDIGAALVDADLMIVDDGAGGTNRKATMSRLATYMGTKIGGGGMEFVASTGAISDAASASFTQFDASKYDNYIFYFMYVKPASDNVNFYGQVSTDGGSNYDSTYGNYHVNSTTDASAFHLNRSAGPGNDTNEYGVCGTMKLFGPHLTTYTYAIPHVIVQGTSGQIVIGNDGNNAALVHLVAADVDAIKFKFSSGNIASGEIIMFGIVNS
jgi:hypothetical protein